MPLVDRIGLGNVSFTTYFFHESQVDFVFIRWSCSGLSCRLLRSTLNLVNFPFHFSSYPSFSVELEWYSRLVLLFIFIYMGRNSNRSFQDACANGFIATLSKDSEFKMSMIHAAYGTSSFLVLHLLTHSRNSFVRCWSITRPPFLYILCSATALGESLSCFHLLGCFQPHPPCRSF